MVATEMMFNRNAYMCFVMSVLMGKEKPCPFVENKILIIGHPGAGKTFLSKTIKGYHVIHTDDFIKNDDPISEIIKISNKYKKVVIEGVYGYRILRRGFKTNSFFPDVVINITGAIEEKHKSMHAGNNTVLNEYLSLANGVLPIWINVNNTYGRN